MKEGSMYRSQLMKDKDLEQGCIDHHCPEKYTQSIGQSSAIKFFPLCSFLSDQRGCVIGKEWICQSKSRPLHVEKGKKKSPCRMFFTGQPTQPWFSSLILCRFCSPDPPSAAAGPLTPCLA